MSQPDKDDKKRVARLLDLIDAVKLTLDGEPVTLDTIQTRIRKVSERHAERLVKEIRETAESLGFATDRVPFEIEAGEIVYYPRGTGASTESRNRWAIRFDRPVELMKAAQTEFDAIMEPEAKPRRALFSEPSKKSVRDRERRALLRKHGLCTQCKQPSFKAGLCEPHYRQLQAGNAERRLRHKELGLCAYCSRPAYRGGYCEDHHEQIQGRIKELQQERREEGVCVVAGCGEDAWKASLCQPHYEASDARKKAFRLKHRELGLCNECTAPATDGIYCRKHAERNRAKASKRRKELVAAGYCRECGQPSSGRLYCEACDAKDKERKRRLYEERVTSGLCGLCGATPEEGRTTCADCRAAQSEYERRSGAARIAAGLCKKCGKAPPEPGKTKCKSCIDKQAERGRRHYEKLKASPVCVTCRARPKAEGKLSCAECLAENVRRQAARRGKAMNPEGEAAPVVLYHGTTKKKLRTILERGLSPSAGWGGAGTFGVYLGGSPESALYWAKIAYLLSKGEKMEVERFDRKYGEHVRDLLAIVEVRVPPEAVENLRADMEQAEDVGFEGESEDWEASLEEIGDVMYDGSIPAEWIREAEFPG